MKHVNKLLTKKIIFLLLTAIAMAVVCINADGEAVNRPASAGGALGWFGAPLLKKFYRVPRVSSHVVVTYHQPIDLTGPLLTQERAFLKYGQYHGLHCGYYALFFARQWLRDAALDERARGYFTALLKGGVAGSGWENLVRGRRAKVDAEALENFGATALAGSDLEFLIDRVIPDDQAKQICVIDSMSCADALMSDAKTGKRCWTTDEQQAWIEKLRAGEPVVMLLNTGCDQGLWGSVAHWICVTCMRGVSGKLHAVVHDSGLGMYKRAYCAMIKKFISVLATPVW